MNLLKVLKDKLAKKLLGTSMVPAGLAEMHRYFTTYRGINFDFEKQADGSTVAVSTNFKYGSIVTSGKDAVELDRNIQDAILTAFEVPSAYAKEANIHKVGSQAAYAPA